MRSGACPLLGQQRQVRCGGKQTSTFGVACPVILPEYVQSPRAQSAQHRVVVCGWLILYFARKIAPNFSETGFFSDRDTLMPLTRASLNRPTINTAGAMMIPPPTIKTTAN